MNSSLTPKLETLVRNKVKTGLYNNASEVIREALRILEKRDRYEKLKSEVGKGFEQIERGETVPYNMSTAKKAARAGLKAGRKVKSVVTP
jgi:antitoxin ParD1/3/4